MIITHKVKMDLMQREVTPRVDVVQGDVCTRVLELALFSGGKEWVVPEGVSIAVRYGKPDKTKGYYDTMPDGTSAWSAWDNHIAVMLAPQMLTVDGAVMAQVEMILDSKLLASFTIQVYVNANPAIGVIKSTNYVNWLQWMKEELDTHLKALTDAFEKSEGVVALDTTLSVEGMAADAAATGAAIRALGSDIGENADQLQQMAQELEAQEAAIGELEGKLNQKTALLEVYPVGAVYISADPTSPASLFGGTWTQLKDQFLLGAGDVYAAGQTGGAATHTLTVAELPSHSHPFSTGAYGVADGGTSMQRGWAENPRMEYTHLIGGGAAHNNMPPYLAVYMWQRIA